MPTTERLFVLPIKIVSKCASTIALKTYDLAGTIESPCANLSARTVRGVHFCGHTSPYIATAILPKQTDDQKNGKNRNSVA